MKVAQRNRVVPVIPIDISNGVQIETVAYQTLVEDTPSSLQNVGHVVVSGSTEVIKEIFRLAMTHGYSIGVVPTASQKNFIRFYDLPAKLNDAIELSLRADAPSIDVSLCNGQILYSRPPSVAFPCWMPP